MKMINDTYWNSLTPNNRLFNINDLTGNRKKNYLLLSTAYMNLLVQFICEKLNLKYYDELLKNSEYKFTPTPQKHMDFYQAFSSKYLKYFYIRNNVYIERLNTDEFEFLKQIALSQRIKLEESTKEFIEKTYKKVTFEDALKNGERCMVFYGPTNLRFSGPNDSIIIGIRYDEFGEDSLDDETWEIQHNNQKDFLNLLMKEIKKNHNLKQNEKIKFEFIKYDDFSIRPVVKKSNRI